MENNLQLSIHPGIEKYRSAIAEIKTCLYNLLDTAQWAGSSMKKHELMTMPVKELQYLDILSQKLSHVMTLNDALLRKETVEEKRCQTCQPPCDHANFIFKLNALQVKTARQDFESMAAGLQKAALVSYTDSIQEQLRSLSARLEAIMVQRLAESPRHGCVSAPGKQMAALYTMESERYVLQWLIDHWQGESKALMQAYQQQGFGNERQEVELF